MTQRGKFGFAILVGVPLLWVLGEYAVGALSERTARQQLAQEQALARQAGMPLTWSEIRLPVVPPEQNAAPIYEEAIHLLKGSMKQTVSTVTKANGYQPDPRLVAKLPTEWPKLDPLFALLEQAAARPSCQFDSDHSSNSFAGMDRLDAFKSMEHLLMFRAEKLDRAGEFDAVIHMLELGRRVASDTPVDSGVFSAVMSMTNHHIIEHEAERLLNRHFANPQVVQLIARWTAAPEQLPDIRRALGTEIVRNQQTIGTVKSAWELMPVQFDDVATSEGLRGENSPDFNDYLNRITFQTPGVREQCLTRNLAANRAVWMCLPVVEQSGIDALSRALNATEDKLDQRNTLVDQVDGTVRGKLLDVADSLERYQARRRMLLASIALIQSKGSTGHYPAALPAGLGPNGIDPFDGKPLRYRRRGDHFAVYSIGHNRIDDGGIISSAGSFTTSNPDEVLQIGLPEKPRPVTTTKFPTMPVAPTRGLED